MTATPAFTTVRESDPEAFALEQEALTPPVSDPGLFDDVEPLSEPRNRPQAPELTLVRPDPLIKGEKAVEMPQARPEVSLAAPTVADVDRLWDWIRADGPQRMTELQVTTSVALHQQMAGFVDKAQAGTALALSVYDDDEHVGFVFLNPIVGSEAVLHGYVGPQARARCLRLCREGFARLQAECPTLHYAVLTDNPRIITFAKRMGFTSITYYASRPTQEYAL